MKRGILVLVLTAVITPVVAAVDLGVVSAADRIRFEVCALDSSGIPSAPDSGHVFVWFQGETNTNAASYSNRWTSAGAGSAEIFLS